MANPPPPYDNITGISRAAMKDNAQETLANYNGNARPGELVVDQTTTILYIGNALGELTAVATPGGATTWALLGNKDGAAGPTAIALGQNAGLDGQANAAIALGQYAGQGGQGGAAISIGLNTGGNTFQGSGAIAIGSSAGYDAQGVNAVAIGLSAGLSFQGEVAVAIGDSAGENNQGNAAVAVGAGAGTNTQGIQAVAIGTDAGATSQANRAVELPSDYSLTKILSDSGFICLRIRIFIWLSGCSNPRGPRQRSVDRWPLRTFPTTSISRFRRFSNVSVIRS